MKGMKRVLLGIVLLAGIVLSLTYGVAMADNDRMPQVVKFEGLVESRPEGSNIGTWVISGQSVEVLEDTQLVEVKGSAEVDAYVVVIARRVFGGRLEAIVLRVQEPAVSTLKIKGFVSEVGADYVVVNGLRIEYGSETEIIGELAVGAFVKIEVQVLPGSYTAIAIEVTADTHRRVIEFEGVIEGIGDTAWVVAGREVMVNERTAITGKPEVGKWAKVRAMVQVQSDGSQSLLALRIKVKEEAEVVKWKGLIERLLHRPDGFYQLGQSFHCVIFTLHWDQN